MFWRKNIGAKAARKMLMKLTTGHAINRVVGSVKFTFFNKYNAI
jgi:hypothetical protein